MRHTKPMGLRKASGHAVDISLSIAGAEIHAGTDGDVMSTIAHCKVSLDIGLLADHLPTPSSGSLRNRLYLCKVIGVERSGVEGSAGVCGC